MSRHRLIRSRHRSRLAAALAAATASALAVLGLHARPRDDAAGTEIVNAATFAAVLAEDAHLFGTHAPSRDYIAEAVALTPVLVKQMATVTPAEIAGLHQPL